MLAEYVNMVTVSAVATTLFLGGWRAPWPISAFWAGANHGWWPMLWFVIKVQLLLFFFIWLRGTLPRVRYDQLMKLGWKVLIPVSMVWLMLVAAVRAMRNENYDFTRIVLYVGGAVVALLLISLVVDVFRDRGEQQARGRPGRRARAAGPVRPDGRRAIPCRRCRARSCRGAGAGRRPAGSRPTNVEEPPADGPRRGGRRVTRRTRSRQGCLEFLDPVAGFGVTFKAMFKKRLTEQYPRAQEATAPRFHGRHQLNRHPDGLEKCVGCELCAWACPADAIYVEGARQHRRRSATPRASATAASTRSTTPAASCAACASRRARPGR